MNTPPNPSSLHTEILLWYSKEGRKSLPWRDKSQKNRAYRVWISEIMLQQTQVKTVLENYYFPFLEKFPTLESLANAKEEEVLLQWRGLGYYTRARNLLKTAKICKESFNGELPNNLDLLQKLPGIGRYTAGAIACFGFDCAVSFVDSNIKRILMRFFALQNPTQNLLESKAKEILNCYDPFNHNQALLDIGATICTPKNPLCPKCPLQSFCQGKANPFLYTQTQKTTTIKKDLLLGIYIQNSKIALTKSTSKLYYNLYNFPNLTSKTPKLLGTLKHTYTKYNLTLHLYKLNSCNQIAANQKLEFFSPSELKSLPISNMTLKILQFLKIFSN